MCRALKPRAAFYKSNSKATAPDGLQGKCKDCSREATRQWQAANRERTREWARHYYWANREAQLAQKREYRDRNTELVRERERRWYRNNAVYYIAKSHWRRAQSRSLNAHDLDYLAILRGDPCAYCGGTAGAIDHIEPLHSGGDGRWENLTASCRSCNSSKRTATLLAFLGRANSN